MKDLETVWMKLQDLLIELLCLRQRTLNVRGMRLLKLAGKVGGGDLVAEHRRNFGKDQSVSNHGVIVGRLRFDFSPGDGARAARL
jgi:hypothetical protein